MNPSYFPTQVFFTHMVILFCDHNRFHYIFFSGIHTRSQWSNYRNAHLLHFSCFVLFTCYVQQGRRQDYCTGNCMVKFLYISSHVGLLSDSYQIQLSLCIKIETTGYVLISSEYSSFNTVLCQLLKSKSFKSWINMANNFCFMYCPWPMGVFDQT